MATPIGTGADVSTLVDHVAGTWPLTRVALERVIRVFESRTVALLTAEEGAFVIKIDRDQRMKHGDEARLEVFAYLEARRFRHVPHVLRTSSGALGAHIAGGLAWILEYIPHEPAPFGEQWAALGAAAAMLNQHRDFPTPFGVPVAEALDALGVKAGDQPFASEMRIILANLQWLADLPADALVHGEINCANAGLRVDGTTVILDWDHAGHSPAALEYGYPLVTQFIDEATHHVDIGAARSFYRAYRDSGGAVDPDQCFASSLFHALRYMWWGDTTVRWRRVRFAIDNGPAIISDALK